MADIFLRRDVNGITPMDLKYMNDNFKYIWLKVFGNITTGDLLDSSITEDKLKNEAVTTDKLAAGSVTADKIEAKTITADQIDLTTLFVGEGGIRIDPSATISWENVTGKENVVEASDLLDYVTNTSMNTVLASYVDFNDLSQSLANYVNKGEWDDLMIDYVQFGELYTQIGSDYVLTGKIAANSILTGEIAGCTILTANGTNYIALKNQYLQIYYNSTPYVRLAYDMNATLGGVLKAYLQLYDWYMTGDSNYLKMNLRGTDILTVNSSGIQTNGVTCQSLSASNNVNITGNLTVGGTVSFSSTAYTVTAKFA
jgi:hypothetical protein